VRHRPARTRSTVVARRRQVLIGLAVIAFFTFSLSLAGFVSWWWQGVADLAVLAFVAHLRSEAKRATAMTRRRHELKARRSPVLDPRPASPVHEAVDVPMPAIVASTVAVGSGPLVINEETWEPVPVPLPTYVTAPVAERPEPMTIDLTRPGSWTEETEREPLFDQEEFDDDFVNYGDDEEELAEIVTRRRAVND
jgi:membrane protein implicated in regulation of membrane protease activity